MNFDNIEAIAQQACFSTDKNVKFEAEDMFMRLVFDMKIQDYPHMLENFSQTVLFVFASYLNKKVLKQKDSIATFQVLDKSSKNWFQQNGSFQRQIDSEPLQKYVSNTIGMVIGTCMKQIFMQETKRKNLITHLKVNQTNKKYKLFLYRNFIDSVGTIDNQMSYVPYRSLVYAFQQEVIPLITEQLYPFFISVSDNVKVNELSHMLPSLSEKPKNLNFDLFREQDLLISQMVLQLLRQVVTFKYNFNINDYQMDGEFENCLISFPQSVFLQIISRQFLESLYFLIQKMILLQGHDNGLKQYMDSCFQCLKKVLLSKLVSLQNKHRDNFIQANYIGLLRLTNIMSTLEQSYQNACAYQLYECGYKFIHGTDCSQMQLSGVDYMQLIQVMMKMANHTIRNIAITNQNKLYHSCSRFAFKVVLEVISPKVYKHIPTFQTLAQSYFQGFMQNLFTNDLKIVDLTHINKISEFQSTLYDFFMDTLRVGSLNLTNNLKSLSDKCPLILKSQNPVKISNFILLISKVMDENFYQRNINYQAMNNQQLLPIGKIIVEVFQFADNYKNSGVSDYNVDLALLLFFEKILNQCLSNLKIQNQEIKIQSRTYRIVNLYNAIPSTDSQFLMFCFNELLRFLEHSQRLKTQYILDILHSMLLKLKWAMARTLFIQSTIAQNILIVCVNISKNSLLNNLQMLKLRKKLFKLISMLSFDDTFDSYKANIDYICQSIEHDWKQRNYGKLVFDLTGICQNIEASLIYKYFLHKIDQSLGIQTVIKTLYEEFGGNSQMLKEVINFSKSLLDDKSLRMSCKKLTITIYNILDITLPYLTKVLESALSEDWDQVLINTYDLISTILSVSYINLYLADRKSKQRLKLFIYRIMDSLLNNQTWVKEFPELCQKFNDLSCSFANKCSELILNHKESSNSFHNDSNQVQSENQEFMNKFNTFIHMLMNLTQTYFKELMAQENTKRSQKALQKLLTAIFRIFSLMKARKGYIHRARMMSNMKMLIEDEQIKLKFLQNLYIAGMSNLKNYFNIFLLICQLIEKMSHFYPQQYQRIICVIGVNDASKISLFQKYYQDVKDDKDPEYFVVNLKLWFSKSESNYQVQYDY